MPDIQITNASGTAHSVKHDSEAAVQARRARWLAAVIAAAESIAAVDEDGERERDDVLRLLHERDRGFRLK